MTLDPLENVTKLRWELGGFSPRYWLPRLLLAFLPTGWALRLRATVYRLCGMDIGPGTSIAGTIVFISSHPSPNTVKIGARCFINSHVFIDASAPVYIGDGVAIGHHVVIITTHHDIGSPEYRAGNIYLKPVVIGNGAWIASGVKLLPGVTIGAGSVVAAGAVVNRDVPPNSLVGGVPAKVIRFLPS